MTCACAIGVAACAHEPADAICPAAGTGDLVVSEIRKNGDPNGTWFEIYNASGNDLDLEGLVVQLDSVDGSVDQRMLVRRSLPLSAGDYTVLGDIGDSSRPDHIDYGFGADFLKETPSSGAVTIFACGVEIDRLVFDNLPTDTTWSDGEATPSADGNDDAGVWCDGTDVGTPGSGNPPCV